MEQRAGLSSGTANAGRRPRGPAARILFGLLLTGGLVFVVLHFGDLRAFAVTVRRAEPLWLVVAILLQLGTYMSVALGWRAVLAAGGTPRPLRQLSRIAVAKLFADQAVPTAGISGNLLLVQQLRGLGASRGTAVAALILSMVGYYAAYALLALAMLLFLWLHHEATALLSGLVTLFLIVAAAIPGLALWLRRRGSRPLPSRLNRLSLVRSLMQTVGEAPAELVGKRRLILVVTMCNGLVFAADAATLQACLAALGHPVSFGTAFVPFMTASIVVTLAPIPLGLGSFEAAATAMLGLLGVPIAVGLAAILLLRTLTLWLPLIPGLLLIRRG